MNMVAECTITTHRVLRRKEREAGREGGREGEGYEVRETADRGSARVGRVEDLWGWGAIWKKMIGKDG